MASAVTERVMRRKICVKEPEFPTEPPPKRSHKRKATSNARSTKNEQNNNDKIGTKDTGSKQANNDHDIGGKVKTESLTNAGSTDQRNTVALNNNSSENKLKSDVSAVKETALNGTTCEIKPKTEVTAAFVVEPITGKTSSRQAAQKSKKRTTPQSFTNESLPKKPKMDSKIEMFRHYQPWVIKTYGDLSKTKTVTLRKYARILRALRGEELNSADSSKFRFWVKSKGFHVGKPPGYDPKPADAIVGRFRTRDIDKEEDAITDCDEAALLADASLDPALYVPTAPVKNAAITAEPVYRKVAIVENFFDIIYSVHVELEGRPGKHAGQKRTYRTITETYAFLPREAVTRFLLGCTDCQKRPRSPSPLTNLLPTPSPSPTLPPNTTNQTYTQINPKKPPLPEPKANETKEIPPPVPATTPQKDTDDVKVDDKICINNAAFAANILNLSTPKSSTAHNVQNNFSSIADLSKSVVTPKAAPANGATTAASAAPAAIETIDLTRKCFTTFNDYNYQKSFEQTLLNFNKTSPEPASYNGSRTSTPEPKRSSNPLDVCNLTSKDPPNKTFPTPKKRYLGPLRSNVKLENGDISDSKISSSKPSSNTNTSSQPDGTSPIATKPGSASPLCSHGTSKGKDLPNGGVDSFSQSLTSESSSVATNSLMNSSSAAPIATLDASMRSESRTSSSLDQSRRDFRLMESNIDYNLPITTTYLKHMRSLGYTDEDALKFERYGASSLTRGQYTQPTMAVPSHAGGAAVAAAATTTSTSTAAPDTGRRTTPAAVGKPDPRAPLCSTQHVTTKT